MALITPTISPSAALRSGASYYRLKQTIDDLNWFNCDVSPVAIAIGPDSDIDMVPVTYFDPDASTADISKSIQVGVGSPWVSPLRARMNDVRRDGTTPGRIILNDSQVSGSVVRRVDQTIFTPTLDLILYFSMPATLPRVRSPYFLNSTITTVAGSQTLFTVPYYGRKRFSMSIYNIDGTKTITAWSLIGYRFLPGGAAWTQMLHTISPASGSTNTIAAATVTSFVLTDARFDVLRCNVTPSASGGTVGYSVETSDE